MVSKITAGITKLNFGNIIRRHLWEMFFIFLSFALMVVVSYFFVRNIVQKQIFNHAKEMLHSAEMSIRSDFREAEVSLINTSLYIENGIQAGWTDDDIRKYLVWKIMATGPGEANIPGFSNIFYYKDGKFISGRRDYIPPADYDPQARTWYTTAVQAQGETAYSSLYTDLITGEDVVSLTRMMGTAEDPWFVGVDIKLAPLFDYVSSLQFAAGGYGVLMGNDFMILVHPNSTYIDRFFGDISPNHATFVHSLQGASGGVIVQQVPNWLGKMMVGVSKQLYNGWYLAIATPVSAYYHDVSSMAGVLSILGFLFMVTLCFILLRFSILKDLADEASRDKSSFLARMSHEIRTPMNSIMGMAEIIQRHSIPGEIREYVDIISQSGSSLLAIINDVLDFSKMESGRLQIEKRNYYLASVINDMINVIRPRAAEKSLDFFVNVDSSIPAELIGDNVRLRQILINLLSNAVKYTKKGFISLDVKIEKLEDKTLRLICSVEDSGIGIKNEDIGRLFTEFTRVDIQSNQGIEGTGLGLAITRGLCRAMGGDITVSSEYERGSVFKTQIIQGFDDETPLARVSGSGQKKILFFDWRTQYVKSLSRIFSSLGIQAECPATYTDFIRFLETGDYDYAFISSKHAMDCIASLGKRSAPLQLIVMVELGESPIYREASSIMMPVYSASIADVLNDMRDGMPSRSAELKYSFTAPSAKVLIVDDISTNLRVAKELMAPYNMNIDTCLSGPEAINLVKNDHYDLVFMDHMMPGMDGIEAAGFIRALETGDGYFQNLPIIALTANAIAGQREIFLENGINDFLAKPIDIQKLDTILEKWIPGVKQIEAAEALGIVPEEKPAGLVIPGVDTETALKNIGCSEEVYLDILGGFVRDASDRAGKLEAALAAEDMELYVTLAHALKGASRSIGAMELGDAAAWLEKNGATEDPALIREKTSRFLEDLKPLLLYISTMKNQGVPAKGAF